MPKLNKFDRSSLEEQFVDHILEDADWDVLQALARERVMELVKRLDDEQLLSDIREQAPMFFWKPECLM